MTAGEAEVVKWGEEYKETADVVNVRLSQTMVSELEWGDEPLIGF